MTSSVRAFLPFKMTLLSCRIPSTLYARACAELQYVLDPRMKSRLIQVDHKRMLNRNGFATQAESQALATELTESSWYG